MASQNNAPISQEIDEGIEQNHEVDEIIPENPTTYSDIINNKREEIRDDIINMATISEDNLSNIIYLQRRVMNPDGTMEDFSRQVVESSFALLKKLEFTSIFEIALPLKTYREDREEGEINQDIETNMPPKYILKQARDIVAESGSIKIELLNIVDTKLIDIIGFLFIESEDDSVFLQKKLAISLEAVGDSYIGHISIHSIEDDDFQIALLNTIEKEEERIGRPLTEEEKNQRQTEYSTATIKMDKMQVFLQNESYSIADIIKISKGELTSEDEVFTHQISDINIEQGANTVYDTEREENEKKAWGFKKILGFISFLSITHIVSFFGGSLTKEEIKSEQLATAPSAEELNSLIKKRARVNIQEPSIEITIPNQTETEINNNRVGDVYTIDNSREGDLYTIDKKNNIWSLFHEQIGYNEYINTVIIPNQRISVDRVQAFYEPGSNKLLSIELNGRPLELK